MKSKPKRKKKKSPADLTTRNAKSYNRRFKLVEVEMSMLCVHLIKIERFCAELKDILKSKRLLTPAQQRLLEDTLK